MTVQPDASTQPVNDYLRGYRDALATVASALATDPHAVTPAEGFAAAVRVEAAQDQGGRDQRGDALVAELDRVRFELGRAQSSASAAKALAARHRVAIGRVKALHVRSMTQDVCLHDGRPWPCPTIQALDGGTT